MILDKHLPIPYLINKVKYDMIVVVIVSITIHFVTEALDQKLPQMPLAIPAFLGTAISILLSFKMNQSYDRWWEARKVWGAIVNDSRTLVLQMQGFLNEEQRGIIKQITYRQIAWCYVLGRSLRGLNPLEELEHLLSDEERNLVSKHSNKSLAILQQHIKDIRLLRLNNAIDSYTHIQFDNTLVRLCDAMGKSERINGTVFPSTYRKYLHFIIYVFIATLSISLTGVNVWFEIPLIFFISVSFFLIEKSAYHLQDPFRNRPSDVSVTAIARNIEINLRQLLNDAVVPEPVKSDEFYIL